MKESADIRKETTDLQNRVQPANTRDLDRLDQNMASRPDLTPVAKQVSSVDSVMLPSLANMFPLHALIYLLKEALDERLLGLKEEILYSFSGL